MAEPHVIFVFVFGTEQNILLFENPLICYFYILSGSNVTFVHIDTFMTWPEAQKYCREHYTDLASVRSSAENQKIMDLKPAEEDVWIGLSKTSWTWSNGSTTTFYYWNDGEPNDQTAVCVMMSVRKLGKWVDATCDQQRPFICHEGKQCCSQA